MSRNNISFILLSLTLAGAAGLLAPVLIAAAELFGCYAALLMVFKVLIKLDKAEKIPGVRDGYDTLLGKARQTVCKLMPQLEKAEAQVIRRIATPGDTLEVIDQRFGYIIGLVGEHEALPPYFAHIITKRILWAYKKKYGDTKMRLFADCRIDVDQMFVILTDEEKQEFAQFCVNPV